MSAKPVLPARQAREPRRHQRWLARYRELGWLERASLVALALTAIAVIVGPILAPRQASAIVGSPLNPPSPAFPFGLDDQGRDIFSRVLIGARASVLSAAAVIGAGIAMGGVIGLVAGMAGGRIDGLLMRFTDVFLALPGTLVSLAIVAALGPSLQDVLIAVGLVWWPWYARIVRGEVRSLMTRPHVEAARMGGAGRLRIAVRHVLPGAISPVIVAASLDVGNLILTLAGLSFLGLGSPPPAAELGSMTAQGFKYLLGPWWIPVFPAIAVSILAFVANLAGDAIRDLVAA